MKHYIRMQFECDCAIFFLLFLLFAYVSFLKHQLIRTPTGPKILSEISNVPIIGWILKGNSRKGIKNQFELAKVRIIGRRTNDVDCMHQEKTSQKSKKRWLGRE